MIAQRLLLLGLVGALLMEVIGSPVSFPTEGPHSKDLEDYPTKTDAESEGRFNHALHREKRKRKRQRLACLAALQQQSNRYRRQAPAKGDGRTLFWGGLNYYDTDIHVYNGGYGGTRPAYAPGQAINPSNPCEGLPVFMKFPSFGNLPSLPNFSNIGNEIIQVLNPGTSFPGSLPGSSSSSSSSSSSGNRPSLGGGGPSPGSGGPSLGGGGPSTGTTPGGGDGDTDNTSEDYDYSDGGSDTDNNRIKRRRRPNQAASSFLQPVDRYLDQFLFRPVDRTFQRIVRWF